ncbi:pseudouridine synthase family protein [Treponema pectinovorum]|uniref:pseudouridine synthase family protein n=1 Tax=Treponema pectinovorum TaxID=164 RepID=UPI0011C75AF9|nr:RNA pseudouridine synthase [Treponema pectinovorum]
MAKIKIIQSPDSTHPFAVIYKQSSLASAPLKHGDDSALTQAINLFPELKNVKGKKEVEHGLLHRIDNATSGLLLIASTQKAYEEIQEQQETGRFIKYYRAIVEYEGEVQNRKFTISSRFRTFGPKGSKVMAVFEDSNPASQKKAGKKIYTTKVEIEGKNAICCIERGFRHQVRVHLASSGFCIKGDPLYNPKAKKSDKFYFEAFKIEFINPSTKEKMVYECSESF